MSLRVRILAVRAGEPRTHGEVLDLPTNEARALIEQERAELVRGEQMEKPERTRREVTATRAQKPRG
jgi:hypothetical protein